MIQQAIASPDPVIVFEPKARYWDKAEVNVDAPFEAATATRSMGRARVARTGDDVTVVAYGPTMRVALQAAQVCQGEGVEAEVIDLRSISPLDTSTVVRSVKKTGRCVVVHEAPTPFGVGAEVAARVAEEAFFVLEAPVLRVGAFYAPYPAAKLEHDYLPSVDRVLDAIDRVTVH